MNDKELNKRQDKIDEFIKAYKACKAGKSFSVKLLLGQGLLMAVDAYSEGSFSYSAIIRCSAYIDVIACLFGIDQEVLSEFVSKCYYESKHEAEEEESDE